MITVYVQGHPNNSRRGANRGKGLVSRCRPCKGDPYFRRKKGSLQREDRAASTLRPLGRQKATFARSKSILPARREEGAAGDEEGTRASCRPIEGEAATASSPSRVCPAPEKKGRALGVVGRPAAGAEVEEVAGRGGVACEIEPLDEKPFVGAAWAVPALAERSAPSLTAAALSKPREGGGRAEN